MNIKKLFLYALFLLTLTACAGTPFDWDNARKIQPGMSVSEVTELLGPPFMATSNSLGLIYTWSYATAFGGSKAISIAFKDGKVISSPQVPETYK